MAKDLPSKVEQVPCLALGGVNHGGQLLVPAWLVGSTGGLGGVVFGNFLGQRVKNIFIL